MRTSLHDIKQSFALSIKCTTPDQFSQTSRLVHPKRATHQEEDNWQSSFSFVRCSPPSSRCHEAESLLDSLSRPPCDSSAPSQRLHRRIDVRLLTHLHKCHQASVKGCRRQQPHRLCCSQDFQRSPCDHHPVQLFFGTCSLCPRAASGSFHKKNGVTKTSMDWISALSFFLT